MVEVERTHPGMISLSNGKLFDLHDPDPAMLTLYEIANALSKTCRFGGRLNSYYSVAEHSVLVMRLGLPFIGDNSELAKLLLFHDAAEALVGDICRPIKQYLHVFRELEHKIEGVIVERFGLEGRPSESGVVMQFDNAMLTAEKEYLLYNDENNHGIQCLNPYRASIAFGVEAMKLGVT